MQTSQKSHGGTVWQESRGVYVLLMRSGNASLLQEMSVCHRGTGSAVSIWSHRFAEAKLSLYRSDRCRGEQGLPHYLLLAGHTATSVAAVGGTNVPTPPGSLPLRWRSVNEGHQSHLFIDFTGFFDWAIIQNFDVETIISEGVFT